MAKDEPEREWTRRKSDWMHEHRVFDRTFGVFYMILTYQVTDWAMGLPDISQSQSIFASAVIAGAAAYFKFYVDTSKER